MRVTTAVALVSALSVATAYGQSADGQPVKFHASCQVDLTGDKRADLVLLVETVRGPELIALVSTAAAGYSTFVLSRKPVGGILSCELGPEVRETKAGRGSGRVVRTPGAFVHVTWPESAAVAYVWNMDRFLEVWTSD